MIDYLVYVERIWDDEVFEALKKFLKKYHCICFILTPTNFKLVQAEQQYQGTKEEWEEIIIPRYREVQKLSEIGLHLHLSLMPEKLDMDEQEVMFSSAILWMINNDFYRGDKLIAFGWHKFSEDSVLLMDKYGLQNPGKSKEVHDYEIPGLNWKTKGFIIASNLFHRLKGD